MFGEKFKNETQVVATVIEHDLENESDVTAMIGVSTALSISGVPFMGPVGCARVGYKDGDYILNPEMKEIAGLDLDLVVAGTKEGVLMVESEASQLSEEIMLGAVEFGAKAYQDVIDLINDFAKEASKEKWELPESESWEADVKAELEKIVKADLEKAYKIVSKQERVSAISLAKENAITAIEENSVKKLAS